MTEKILDQQKGVGYYNSYNIDNSYNEYNYANRFQALSLGVASGEALSPEDLSSSQEGAEPLTVVPENQAPTPLDQDQVLGWIAQLFDNGETAFQRYKFKLRLNLTDGASPEFIASLTKDLRNFKKYLPENNRSDILTYVMSKRREIKDHTGSFPYLGKFHFNQGLKTKKQKTSNIVEPDTFVIVWWDPENRGWSAEFMIQNFHQELDMFSEYLTAKQTLQGIKAQEHWRNPKHDQRPRAKTWAEQRKNQG